MLLLAFTNTILSGQAFVENITKFFEFPIGRAADSSDYQNKMVIAPVAIYEPNTSLGLGIGAKFLFKPRRASAATRTSNIPASIIYTLNNQFIVYSGYTVFFNEEKYLLKGNLEYSKFPLSYYGIGSTSTDADIREITYSQFLLEPLLLRKISDAVFIGAGVRLNTFRGVKLYENDRDLPAGTSLQDELGSTSLGLELAITLDNRDNVLNAAEGTFAEFTHGFYDDVLGGTNEFMLTKLDFRRYFKLWASRPDVLALGLYTRLSWQDTPPLDLSALGGAELLRGFQEGRFRDKYAFFTQAEYRWQALPRIGFVFFGGVGEVANKMNDLRLDRLKYSLGGGLRLKIVKSENLNIRFDYALGLGAFQDQNFYLGIAESF